MMTARTIIDAIGSDAMQSRLGVTKYSIQRAKEAGTMPANWYVVVSGMCRESGIDCPADLFNFKSPSSDAPSSEVA